MKIIDKTPLQDQKGDFSFTGRIQGTLKFGLSWFSDLEAQKSVIALLDRILEKGYVLIRNFTLPGSDIVIPIILIGPGGVQVISITQVRGLFEAKGDQWNTTDNNGRSQPAGINLIGRVSQYARALQKYMRFQKIDYPDQIEPVLISTNPGAHIESMRPVARVVQSDAIKQFAASLLQARPVLRADQVYQLAEYITDPLSSEANKPEVLVQPQSTSDMADSSTAATVPPASRAQAIFNSEQTPFDPNDLGFAFEEDKQSTIPPHLRESSPAIPLPAQPEKKKIMVMGMTVPQLALLAVMLIVECCVLIGFAFMISMNQ